MSTVRQPTSAMISVIEKARGRSDEHPSVHFFSLALLAVFFVALMTCLVAGAHVYRTAAQAQEQANERHLGSGLIANIARAHDTANVARIAEGPEGPALVLARRTASRTYETRIYHYQGAVLQESAVEGRPFDPQSATRLLDTTTFDVTLEGTLLTFTTDQGSFCVTLRSTQSGTPTDEGGAS